MRVLLLLSWLFSGSPFFCSRSFSLRARPQSLLVVLLPPRGPGATARRCPLRGRIRPREAVEFEEFRGSLKCAWDLGSRRHRAEEI